MRNSDDSKRRRTAWITMALVGLLLIGPAANAAPQDKLTPDVARALANEAWLFGLPLVMFEKQVDYSTYSKRAGGNPGTN